MLFKKLDDASLPELLALANKEGIKVASQICPHVIRAEIASKRNLNPDRYFFTGIRENYRAYRWFLGAKPTNTIVATNLLTELGINVQYISPNVHEGIYFAMMFERRQPISRSFWYQESDLKYSSEILAMPLDNWESIIPFQMSQEDFIKIIAMQVSPPYMACKKEFAYQTWQSLLQFFNSIPYYKKAIIDPWYEDLHFVDQPTMKYLISASRDFGINEAFRNYFKALNSNAYPGRPELVSKMASFPSEISPSLSEALLYPPFVFEQALLKGEINLGVAQKQGLYTLFDSTLPRRPTPIPDYVEFGQLISNKSPVLRNITREQMLILTGYNGNTHIEDSSPNVFSFIDIIKKKFNTIEFDINRRIDICPHKQTYLYFEELRDFVITFGTYFKFVCFDPSDLEQFFRLESVEGEELFFFRNPAQPAVLFTELQVKQLSNLISQQAPTVYTDFTNRTRGLIEKIGQGLNNNVNILKLVRQIRVFLPEYGEIIKEMFFDLFYAGMKQRLWEGPGHPYPMKTSETRGSCQASIDREMAPYLSHFNELRNGQRQERDQNGNLILGESYIPEALRYQINRLPLIYGINNGIPVPYSETIDYMVTQAITPDRSGTGQFCVGWLGSYMVLTGYFYLNVLDFKIPGFDVNKFESEGTHR